MSLLFLCVFLWFQLKLSIFFIFFFFMTWHVSVCPFAHLFIGVLVFFSLVHFCFNIGKILDHSLSFLDLETLFFYSKIKKICLLIFEREREREHRCEREKLLVSHICPDQGLNLQLSQVPWLGFEPPIFWCMGWCSNQLSHTSQGLTQKL